MHANDFVVNDGGARQAIEGVTELLPHFDREATTALVVKSVDAINACAFVVSSQEKEILRILNFVGKQKADNFQRLFATVDIVTEEQIVRLRVESRRKRQERGGKQVVSGKSLRSMQAPRAPHFPLAPLANANKDSPPVESLRTQRVEGDPYIVRAHHHKS